MKKLTPTITLALSLLLAACGQLGLEGQVLTVTPPPSPSPAATGTPVATPTAAASATAVPPATAADPTAACPTPATGQALYVSRENGYCFLYPSAYTAQPDFLHPAQGVLLSGPGVTDAQDHISVNLTVVANGPADGLDSQSYAQKWLTVYRLDPTLAFKPLDVNGQPAAVLDNAPGGMFSQRQVLLVAQGFKYSLTLSPRPEDEPRLADSAEQAWALMLKSLVLFAPAQPRPLVKLDQVCPTAGADTKLYVDEGQGFCVLYPADFGLRPDRPGEFSGGPVLLDSPEWGQVRTALTVAGYDQPPSPDQHPTVPEVNIDPSTVVTTTIGGAPALTYDFVTGPWRQRSADVLANGNRYSMVGPWDAQKFPQGLADAQRVWDTVTQSIVFFDKWR